MFEGFKTLASMGGENAAAKAASAELIKLIRVAREQKTMLEAALNQVETKSSSLSQTAKSLERVEKRAVTAGGRLDDLEGQAAALTSQTRSLDEAASKIDAVIKRGEAAEQLVIRLTAPDGQLETHRQALQRLDAQAAETRASIDALSQERAVVEDVRRSLRDAQGGAAQSAEQLARLQAELQVLRGQAPELAEEYGRLKAMAREEREYADRVMGAVREIEKKIGALTSLDELSKTTEERLASLTSLAEHVSLKVKALEGQRDVVERALLETNRLNEMVWAMDAQVTKLSDSGKHITRTEELLERLETLSTDTTAHLETGTKAKDELAREIAKTQRDAKEFSDFARTYLDRVGLARMESNALEQRLSALTTGMGDVEARLETAAAKERSLAAVGQRIDATIQRVGELSAHGDELARRQEALRPLQDRLSHIEELSKRTATQMDHLARARQDLDVLRGEFQDLSQMTVEVAKTRDSLTSDRLAIEATTARLAAFHARLPEIDGKLDGVLSRLQQVDDAAEKAERIGEDSVMLDQQLTKLRARSEFVELLHARVNELNVLASHIGEQLKTQLAREGDLEQMRSATDGLAVQLRDVEQRVVEVSTTQTQLVPLKRQVATLEKQIAKVLDGVNNAQLEAGALAGQEKRLASLLDEVRTVSTDVADRLRQVRGLADELKRASAASEEMSAELSRVQGHQREVTVAVEAADGQIQRVETLVEQLEMRRTQLLFMESTIGAFETKIGQLKLGAEALDEQIKAVAGREQTVRAIKGQADGIKDVVAETKADLEQVLAHRHDIAALKTRVAALLDTVTETDQKIVLVEDRKAMVEEVHLKTNTIVNMMGDVRVTLETLTEHSAVVDVVSDKVAKLDFAVHQAQNTLNLLQRERELADQIDRALRQLRRKREDGDDGRKTA